MNRIATILFLAFLTGCNGTYSESKDLKNFLPEHSALVVKMQDPDLFFSNLTNNSFFRENQDHPHWERLNKSLSLLEYFPHKNPALLSISFSKQDDLRFSFISRGLFKMNLDSVQNKMVETISFEGKTIKKYTLEDQVAYSASRDSVFVFSNSVALIKKSLFQQDKNFSPAFEEAMKAASTELPSLILNHQRLAPLLYEWLPEEKLQLMKSFSNWSSLDIDLKNSSIQFNGITTAKGPARKVVELFKGVGVSENNIASITPANSAGFYSISFRSFSKLQKNISAFHNRSNDKISSEELDLLQTADQAAMIYLSSENVFAVHTLDTEAARRALSSHQEVKENFRDTPIYRYEQETSFYDLLHPLIKPEDLKVMAFLDDFVLFAPSAEALQHIIIAVQNDQVFNTKESYQLHAKLLSSQSSILAVFDNQLLKQDFIRAQDQNSGHLEKLSFKDYPMTGFQVVYQDQIAHMHVTLPEMNIKEVTADVAQVSTAKLGAPINTGPVFFKNHRTDGMDVVVQDKENILYLISPTGKIYWKKKLSAPIIGNIQAVDLLRNGRYQLAFSTRHQIHVIDRAGNVVPPFPLNFNDAITQPLSVFDYDKNRKYRFVVVQDRNIYVFDNRGRRVKGFRFSKAGDQIVQPPRHIRIGRKDYILVLEASGKLNILSRTGKTRVPLSEKLEVGENPWYEHEEHFLSATASGELLKIDQQGDVKRQEENYSEDLLMDANEDHLVVLSENELFIDGKKIILDFGLYTKPKLFHVNNKVFVGITDIQTSKSYLFSEKGNLLSGFPVYGKTLFDLANADEDSHLEMVVQGEEDNILIYEIR